ncbi:hypothetical protein Ancab_034126 [Ancistrocladus abbreviatus]
MEKQDALLFSNEVQPKSVDKEEVVEQTFRGIAGEFYLILCGDDSFQQFSSFGFLSCSGLGLVRMREWVFNRRISLDPTQTGEQRTLLRSGGSRTERFSSFLISDEEVGFLLLVWLLFFLFWLILALLLEGGGDLVGG